MITVKDTDRTISFTGKLLASSTSYTPGKSRWIEFKLYHTETGDYLLSRLGATLVFHSAFCDTVRRNCIDPLPSNVLAKNMVPCEKCRPQLEYEEFVYPEVPRHWAQSTPTAEGVLSFLVKYDEFDSPYYTTVARNLITDAAKNDDELRDIYYNTKLT